MLNPNLGEIQLTKEEYERYSRHVIVPELGLEGQKRLKAASVVRIGTGTGGLDSPLLLYLAAMSIGRIRRVLRHSPSQSSRGKDASRDSHNNRAST
jgi:adenylyltransferase/sulfurtransferase